MPIIEYHALSMTEVDEASQSQEKLGGVESRRR